MQQRFDTDLGHCLAACLSEETQSWSSDQTSSRLNAFLDRDDAFLSLLGAVLYARRDTVAPWMIEAVVAMLAKRKSLASEDREFAVRLLELVAVTDEPDSGLLLAFKLLSVQERRGPRPALRLLRALATWHPRSLDPEPLSAHLARSRYSRIEQEYLLLRVINPLAFAVPDRFTDRTLEQLESALDGVPGFRYFLYYLAGRGGTHASVRARCTRLLAGRFPLHEPVSARLSCGQARLLAVNNINDSQGDEIVRMGPLLQAFLDFNPGLEITLITRRVYLYDHERVRVVPITDRFAARECLDSHFDVVLDFYQGIAPWAYYDGELGRLTRQYAVVRKPFLCVVGPNGTNAFTYADLRVDGRCFARKMRLDGAIPADRYEPARRLIAELGLPLRAGNEAPRGGSLFVGRPSRAAEDKWNQMVSRSRGVAVLLNPFGGAGPLKGYTEEVYDRLRPEIERLVRTACSIVILPNGTAWGGPAAIAHLVNLLPAWARRFVFTPEDLKAGEVSRERPDLSSTDRPMWFYKYFLSYAVKVTTVEGWAAHLAYQTGRPLQVMVMPQSQPDWIPTSLGPHQSRIAGGVGLELGRSPDLLGEKPILPSPPRKEVLVELLPRLALASHDCTLPLILNASRSRQRSVRAAAATALRSVQAPGAKERLLALLADPSSMVRRAAAESLLSRDDDLRVELGAKYRTVLKCHCWIADQAWRQVIWSKSAALFPLTVALTDEDHLIRREATQLFAALYHARLPRPKATDREVRHDAI